MNIGLVVNVEGKICLVHDEPLEERPLCVGYHLGMRQLEIYFESGNTYPIDWKATDEMHNFLVKVSDILIVRMENHKPAEGFKTSFISLLPPTQVRSLREGDYSLHLDWDQQAVVQVPWQTWPQNLARAEYNGVRGSLSIIHNERKTICTMVIPTELSYLHRSILSCDRLKVVLRSNELVNGDGKEGHHMLPLDITFNGHD